MNESKRFVVAAALLLVACEKKETVATEPSPPPPSAVPVATTTATASASATAEAPAVASAAPGASASAPRAAASASAAPSAKPSASAAAAPLTPASTRVEGKNFALDVATPGCRADADCVATIRLSALGDYHVNKEYPYKFVAQPAPPLTFLGKDDPNTFSKAAGDFREEGEKAATMTVRFRPRSAGEAKVSGTYKMSVCSAENCQIETPKVELTVAVK